MVPRPFRVTKRRRELADTWTLELEPVGGERVLPARRASSPCSTRSGSARCRSRSRATSAAGPLVHTVRAVGAVSRAICASEPGAVLGVRGPFGNAWPVDGGRRRATSSSSRAESGSRRSGRRSVCRRSTAREYGDVALLYGSRTPDRPALSGRSSSAWAAASTSTSTSRSTRPSAAGTARSASCPKLDRRRARSTRRVGGRVRLRAGDHDALRGRGRSSSAASRAERIYVSMERNMQCGLGHCGHCQLGPTLICRDGPVYRYDELERLTGGARAVSAGAKPTLAVWKFASCDGCQLSLLDCEDELLALAGEVEIAYFLEASERDRRRARTTSRSSRARSRPHHDIERIQEVRRASRALVTIGACATAGGIQALQNFADVDEYVSVVYATPEYISTLDTSTPISAHVPGRLRAERLPDQQAPAARGRSRRSCTAAARTSPSTSVCMECKRRGTVCVTVAHGTPCLGPVTHAGCGALCPSYNRGCYGCFGPMETPNMAALTGQLREPRHGREGRRPRPSHVQRRAGSRRPGRGDRASARRRSRPTTLARVEGEGAMIVRIAGGEVEEVKLNIYEPPRFFEAFLRGRAVHGGRPTSRPGSAGSARSPTR